MSTDAMLTADHATVRTSTVNRPYTLDACSSHTTRARDQIAKRLAQFRPQ